MGSILLFGGPALAETVALATLPPGAITNVQGQVMARVVQKNTELKIRVVPIGGGIAQLSAVNARQAEFALWDPNDMTVALNGTHHFKGKKKPNLLVAARLMTFPIGVFVRKNSSIKSIADLKGKRFPAGWTASPNSGAQAEALLATAGLKFSDIKPVATANLIRAAEDFKAGKTDAMTFAVGAPKVAEVNAAVGGIRFLSIGTDSKSIARLKSVRPDYFYLTVKPNPRFAGIVGPTNVMGIDLVLIAGTHVADKTVYNFIKALYGNKMPLAKGHPSFFGFQPKAMAKQFAVAKYHPGAIAFFKEIGIWKK